jgi:hypothetical protein
MSFKSNIPEQVLAHPNTRKFVSVMDGVNEVKSDIIFTSLRAYNPALLLDKNWLLKRLGDYGVDFIPMEFPLPVIQQFLLNADIILGTRGSKKGVELFLSVMTLGTVSVNFNSFYADPQVLLLNSLIQGHIVGDTTDPKFYLIGNSDIINPFPKKWRTVPLETPRSPIRCGQSIREKGNQPESGLSEPSETWWRLRANPLPEL